MKTPVILQKLILEAKTFFTDLNFHFNNSISLIHGNYGSGKTTLLKIINLLTDNNELNNFDLLNHLFKHRKEYNKSLTFKYELNPEFLNYAHPIIICIHLTEENIEMTSEPPFSSQEIEQIIQKLNIKYIDLVSMYSSFNSSDREDLAHLSVGEQTWEIFLEVTRELRNTLILIDDIQSGLDGDHKIMLLKFIENLAQYNQIIITSSNSLTHSLSSDFFYDKRFSEFNLKNPWQKNIYNYFKEELKSDYFREFQLSIKNIKKTLKLKLNIEEKRVEDFLIRILYANIITAMETYLSDCFIEKVINNKKYIPKLLELIPEFSGKEFKNLKKAYDWIENINDNIIDILSGISFHNLAKVIPMYKNILNIEFPQDLGDTFRAILIRHDIVHRNGKTKDNEEVFISKLEINNLLEHVSRLIEDIELQVKKI